MTEIVAIDIGGTHARFAVAQVDDKRVTALGEATTFGTADHDGLESAWEAFAETLGSAPPRFAAIAVAAPVGAGPVALTNSSWIIDPARLDAGLGIDGHILINDLAAVAHAVATLEPRHLDHLCGPDQPLPDEGIVSVIGSGTGFGVAQLLRAGGAYTIVPTEGGHIDFAPLDAIEDAILTRLRARFGRVSVERICSGPGLAHLYQALAAIDGETIAVGDPADLWTVALAGRDRLAGAAFDRFRLCLGAVAGDLALAHGATGVVIAGGVGRRIAKHLPASGFAARFVAKGRFAGAMAAIPVKTIAHPEPGLLGAAAAFAGARPDL